MAELAWPLLYGVQLAQMGVGGPRSQEVKGLARGVRTRLSCLCHNIWQEFSLGLCCRGPTPKQVPSQNAPGLQSMAGWHHSPSPPELLSLEGGSAFDQPGVLTVLH